MRKVFYVKKNPTMPMSNDNWIEMNSFEFEQFIHTPEGRERRYNFGRLDACSEDDAIIYIECGAEKAKEWESEINRRKYIQKVKKACDVTVCSYSALISDDYPFETYSGEAFVKAIRKFMSMKTLTAPLLRELIDHIDVYEVEGQGKNKTQRVVIYYKFVGYLEIPNDLSRPTYSADLREGVSVEYITCEAGEDILDDEPEADKKAE